MAHSTASEVTFRWALALLAAGTQVSCGGSSTVGPSPAATPTPVVPVVSARPGQISSTSAVFDSACGQNDAGTLYPNAEVEPYLAVNPLNPANLVGVWQQDRWSNGGARGLVTASSFDGGATWTRRTVPYSVCSGGRFERASDPWVTASPNGVIHQMALVITGAIFAPTGQNGMMVSRSSDGGLNWSPPISLIQDAGAILNDKNSITADSSDARYVYAVWDRLRQQGGGPAYFARTTDGGVTWEPARSVYDPGRTSQILGAEIVVLGNGDLLYFFNQIDFVSGRNDSSVVFLRSRDKGETWEGPTTVSRLLSVGTRDPETGTAVRDGSLLPHAAAFDSTVAVTWPDARFSNGAHDGVAFAMSRDGGRTFSEPVQINGVPASPAFIPQPIVFTDRSFAVAYFDFRANTPDPATLPTAYWLARSQDGVNWSETLLDGPFNLSNAPNANGLFIGDYMGFASAGGRAVSLHAVGNDDPRNATDLFFGAVGITANAVRTHTAVRAPQVATTPPWIDAVSENIARRLGPKLVTHPKPLP